MTEEPDTTPFRECHIDEDEAAMSRYEKVLIVVSTALIISAGLLGAWWLWSLFDTPN